MRIHEMKRYIENGGKFYVKDNGVIREVKFLNVIMKPKYECSICPWSIEITYKVATENGAELRYVNKWEHKKVSFYTDINACANDSQCDDELSLTKGDGSLVDDCAPLLILKSNGIEVQQGFYCEWPMAYIWENCKVKQVHPKLEVDILHESVTIDPRCYKTALECQHNNAINVVVFPD